MTLSPEVIGLILSNVLPLLNQVVASLSFLKENREPTQAELDTMVKHLEASTAYANQLRDHLLSLKAS